jgi:hypothetical protein
MKFRTDFVTNSSSVSTAEVVVDNPLLLEILSKYKEMGTFFIDEDLVFWRVGTRYENEEVTKEFFEELKGATKSPAFYYLGDNIWHPHSLDDVLVSILGIMENDIDDSDLWWKLNEELNKREKEIIVNYLKIYWSGGTYAWGSELPSLIDYSVDELKNKNMELKNPGMLERLNVDWIYKYDSRNGESFDI